MKLVRLSQSVPDFVLNVSLSMYRQGQASGMDGTLTLIFTISETIRDNKKFIKRYQNTFKSYEKFQSLEELAQKLSMPSLFDF